MPARTFATYWYYLKDNKYSLSQPKKDPCDICKAHSEGNVPENMQHNDIKGKDDARDEI